MIDTDQKTTRQATGSSMDFTAPMLTGLTVIWHPDIARIGEVMPLVEFTSGRRFALNRTMDGFRLPYGQKTGALKTNFVSRKFVVFEAPKIGGIHISCEDGVQIRADGEELSGRANYRYEDLRQGVVLVLGNAVVLLFHLLDAAVFMQETTPPPSCGFVGNTSAMHKLRENICNVAATNKSVLIRGDTGVGKDLAARAVHQSSSRRSKAFLTVNVAGIPAGLAASELFGCKKGAFSGAESDKAGYFGLADGGTLFLDEIGDLPHDIQMLILRAVECKEIQAVGGGVPTKVDVRLIAATDSDLEQVIEAGQFKRPLYERLQESAIHIPPLRERKADIGLLFLHFLKRELESSGEMSKLAVPAPGKSPWMPALLIEKLLNYEWPGNVRELKNIASRIADVNRGGPRFKMDDSILRLLDGDRAPMRSASQPSKSRARRCSVAQFSDGEILEALEKHSFNISNTAEALNVSAPRLHARIGESPMIPKAGRLTEEQILRCRKECGDNIDRMAERLRVSGRGLKIRMRQLGITL